MHIFKDTKFDFLRWRWYAIALSWIVVLAGVVTFMSKGMPLGIEFAGGTAVVVKFDQPTTTEHVREALDKSMAGGEVVIQPYGQPAMNMFLIRVPTVGAESGNSLSSEAARVEAALKQGGLSSFTRQGAQIVGPAVGKELRNRALLATIFSLAGLLAYIAFRFQFSFAVGAVVATVHDLLVTLALLVIFRYDMTLNVIAAILTITGFSTNDTIVIFDRIRENMRSMRRDSLAGVINTAINQTLGRTIITSGTALLTSLALFLFGGEVLHGFAFTMVVGIITGTYSSVFIAAAIISFWRSAAPTRAAAHAPAPSTASSSGAPQQPARKAKPQRKARAS
ncbi:MAG TPA: protein translocase subunit SecF [Vicinamibacterales bacterium]|jgi:preprotein translocase subunit SecF|nr:protein translocase subunit SecF [Vicinamibacterales bacterium]